MDVGAAFTGSAKNDTYSALDGSDGGVLKNSFGAGDQLNGGAGVDSLVISTLTATYSLPTLVKATGIENLSVETVNTGTTTVDTSGAGYADLTAVSVSAASKVDLDAAETQAVVVNNTAGGVDIAGGLSQTVTTKGGFAISDGVGAISVVDTAQGAVDSAVDGGTTVSITSTAKNAGGTTGKITVGGTDAPTGAVTISSTISEAKGTTNTAGGAIAVTGGTTVSVAQTAVKALQTTAAANGTITNAAVTVDGKSTTTSVTATASAAVTAVDTRLAVAGVTEVSTVTFGALAATETLTINGLTFTAGAAGTTKAQTAAAFANLAAGATQGASTLGTYTGTFIGAAATDLYTTGAVGGTSTSPTVVFTGALAGNLADITLTGTGSAASSTAVTTAGVTAVTAAGKTGVTANSVTVTDVNNGSTTKAGTITSVTASNYTTATVNSNALSTLSLTGGSGDITIGNGGLVGNTVTTLNLTLNGVTGGILDDANVYKAINVTATGVKSTLADITDTALTTLTVAGDKGLTLTSTAGATALANVTVTGSAGLTATFAATTMKAIDTSGTTGTATITYDATKATYTGGAGVDAVTTSGNVSKAVNLGDGNDTLTLGGTVSAAVAGGAGTDTLSMTAAAAATASGDLAFAALVTGFEALTLTGATGTQSVNLVNLGYTSNVTVGKHAAGGTLTLSGLVSGGTVTIADQNVQAADILALSTTAWAATGSNSDTVNVNIGGAAVAANIGTSGTVELASVESVTLNATHATATAAGAAIAAGTYSNAIAITDTTTVDVLATLNVTGNAAVTLDLAGATALRTINASANTGGVTVTAASTLAATITGGSGNDSLTAKTGTNADTLIGGAGNDTLTSNAGLSTLTGGAGNDLFVVATAGANSNVYTTISDASAGDRIQLSNLGVETFATTKLSLAATASFADYVNFATDSTTANTDSAISWFQLNGNTYIVQDKSASADFVNGTDIVVALTGLIDLSTASLAYNAGGAPNLAIFG